MLPLLFNLNSKAVFNEVYSYNKIKNVKRFQVRENVINDMWCTDNINFLLSQQNIRSTANSKCQLSQQVIKGDQFKLIFKCRNY